VADPVASQLETEQFTPILLDVGANGDLPWGWSRLATAAMYVGLGPASVLPRAARFRWTALVKSLVVPRNAAMGSIDLHVAVNPIFSSVLTPKSGIETQFVDLDVAIACAGNYSATTIDDVVRDHSLPSIDWLHTNASGIDGDLCVQMSDPLRRRLLAVDTVFFLMEIWDGQTPSPEGYPRFIEDGFWLTRAVPYGPVKIERETLTRLSAAAPNVTESVLAHRHRRSPGWLFVRFFRTLASMRQGDFSAREYVVLWAFAMIDGQFGFAADIVLEYERLFGKDGRAESMWQSTVASHRALGSRRSLHSLAARILPEWMKSRLRGPILGA